MHSRPIGVENAGHLDVRLLSIVVEKKRFGTPFALIVAGPRADGIYCTPVSFSLRVFERVPVHFGSGCLEDPDFEPLCEPEHVDGAMDVDLGGLYRIVLIMDRGGRAGQVIDLVHLHIEGIGYIVPKTSKYGLSRWSIIFFLLPV